MDRLNKKLTPWKISGTTSVSIYLILLSTSTPSLVFFITKQQTKNKEIRAQKSYNKITILLNWITTFNLYV